MHTQKYRQSTPDQPAANIPIARAWDENEWHIVANFRERLDELLEALDQTWIHDLTRGALVGLGERLACYAMCDGCYIQLDTVPGGYIHRLPEDVVGRYEVDRWLENGFGKRLPAVPSAPGLHRLVGVNWEPCSLFLHKASSALVAHPSLLSSFPHWAIAETRERTQVLEMEISCAKRCESMVAQVLREKSSGPESTALLEVCTRLLNTP